MALVDSHAHLDFEDFAGDRRHAVLARSRAAGVTHCVLIGLWRKEAGLASCRATVEMAASDPSYFSATVGVHPHEAALAPTADLDGLAALAADPRVRAVGECGLDYHYDHAPRETQRTVFARQLDLAVAVDKPIVVHTREADADTSALLAAQSRARGVIHCFTGDSTAVRAYLDRGLFISLSGVVTFKNAEALRAAAKLVPLDRLLVETDCPFLAPVPHRGKSNEPALVVHTLFAVAELKGVAQELLAQKTAENAREIFGLPESSVADGPVPTCPFCAAA